MQHSTTVDAILKLPAAACQEKVVKPEFKLLL
jgi:hypothetical protein